MVLRYRVTVANIFFLMALVYEYSITTAVQQRLPTEFGPNRNNPGEIQFDMALLCMTVII